MSRIACSGVVGLALSSLLLGCGQPSTRACHVSQDRRRHTVVFFSETSDPEGCAVVRLRHWERGWGSGSSELDLPLDWHAEYAGWQPERCGDANPTAIPAKALTGYARFERRAEDEADVSLSLSFDEDAGAPQMLRLEDEGVSLREACADVFP